MFNKFDLYTDWIQSDGRDTNDVFRCFFIFAVKKFRILAVYGILAFKP